MTPLRFLCERSYERTRLMRSGSPSSSTARISLTLSSSYHGHSSSPRRLASRLRIVLRFSVLRS